MKITEVSLGFPINKTIETDFADYADALTCKMNKLYNYKLIVRLTEEERKKVTEQVVIDAFKANNPQAESVKVVFDVQRSQHIRSPEIIRAKTNSEKLAEYLKVNGLDSDCAIYDTLKGIEDNLDIRYVNTKHSFTLLKIRLRGSIGMREKSGREEYELDFRSYPHGIIALTGAVGHGKTTLIENCHPYPQMLTRGGKLQDHFYLRDSCRQLLYVDETGTYYDIDIQVDGKTKTGKVKAFVKSGKDVQDLEPLPECDGNVDSYTKWVNDTFGTIDLYLRTAFYTRGKTGSVPDIAYATKGEKKALFSTLIGIEGLTDISLAAREMGKETARETERLSARLVDLTEYDSVENTEKKIQELRRLVVEIDKEIPRHNAHLSELSQKLSADTASEIKAIDTKIESLLDGRAELEAEFKFVEKYEADKADYERSEKFYKELKEAENNYRQFVASELEPLQQSYRLIEDEKKTLELERKVLVARREEYERNLADDVDGTCPTCGQQLPSEKITELKEALREKKEILASMYAETDSLDDRIRLNEDILRDHEYNKASETCVDMETRLEKLHEQEDDYIPIETVVQYRTQYNAIKSPGTLGERIDGMSRELESLETRKKELSESDDSDIRREIADTEKNIRRLEREKQDALVETGRLTEQKEALLEAEKSNADIEHQIAEKKSLEAQYDVLERAFGANGIQALELEALSPEIADITNGVLESVFGGEYKVSFQTLRVGTGGNLIEDFNILVETVGTGTVRPLEWVSGGEGTIIKEALYNAFGIARQKSCGVSFRTKFMDEMDSAIDPDFRPKYLQMVRSVHDISGTEHTVMITHSSEIKDSVESRIEL